ncbi:MULTISPECIES: cell surface protein [Glutamicibacter]|uniref:Uncharacterized protein n=1 Tax=Glutamicibacter halophytocola TaxID=1933880 RepID=A0AA95BRH1_9MICC|nr:MULTISPECIES: cell surface protein [Glutamicibacter]MBF6670696.1 cell surface protein [Glutamicibacter sp. FBE19]UUX58512.1 hypothetical protein NUH22_14600 [Glutamicibacter halophytocola]
MSRNAVKAFRILYALALTGLNAAVIAFYTLWQIADTAAINRMETGSGMDVVQMLPNSNLMWAAAHGSLIMLIIVDIMAFFQVMTAFSSHGKVVYNGKLGPAIQTTKV